MTDDTWIRGIIPWLGAPLWIAVLIYAIRSSKDWSSIMGRWNERLRDKAAERSDIWARLREENARLHDQLSECQTEKIVWMERAIKAEAFNQGRSEVRQAEAIAQAEVRADPAKAPEATKAAARVRRIRDERDTPK